MSASGPRGCLPLVPGGGCLLRVMCLLWGRGGFWLQGSRVSASGPGGCLPLVPGEGGCLLCGMGVSGSGEVGVVCIPACTGADTTSPMNRMTDRC